MVPQELSFNEDGKRTDVELKILNLRDGATNTRLWEEVCLGIILLVFSP